MVEKELGLTAGDEGSPLRGALIMGAAFGAAALIPIVPFMLVPVTTAQYGAVVFTALGLFAMGVLKSRWTRRHWLPGCRAVSRSWRWARSRASRVTSSAQCCRCCLGWRASRAKNSRAAIGPAKPADN
jgi:hypothetical protein